MSVATATLRGRAVSKSIKSLKEKEVFTLVEFPDPKWSGQTQSITIPGDLELGQVVDLTFEWNTI